MKGKLYFILSVLIIALLVFSSVSCQEDAGTVNDKIVTDSSSIRKGQEQSEKKPEVKQQPEGFEKQPSSTTAPTETAAVTIIKTLLPTETAPLSETTVEIEAPIYTTQPEQSTASQPPDFSDYISKMFNIINTARAEQGLQLFSLNSTLCEIASSRSNDMLARNYFSHTTPEGKNIFIILQENGIGYNKAGENIQHSYPASNASAEMYYNSWMNSSVHRENILTESFSQIGIGFGFKDGWFVSTLVFLG